MTIRYVEVASDNNLQRDPSGPLAPRHLTPPPKAPTISPRGSATLPRPAFRSADQDPLGSPQAEPARI